MIYRKLIIFALIFFLLTAAVAPSIDANKSIKSETLDEKQTKLLGSIYGHTGIGYIWGFSPVRFAKVQAGGKTTISGPIMGEYRIRGLPLGTYTVTGSKKGYETYTTTVTLTEQRPDKQAFINLQPTETTSTEQITNSNISLTNNEKINPSKNLKFGLIHGDTMWAEGWTCGPLKFTRIVARGENYYRAKRSGFLGIYFLIVPLNKEISITASKIGHETETKTVILTEENRVEYVGFMLNVL